MHRTIPRLFTLPVGTLVLPLAAQRPPEPPQAPPQRIEIHARAAQVDAIGRMRLKMGWWGEIPPVFAAARAWSGSAIHGSAEVAGQEVLLFADGGDATRPGRLWRAMDGGLVGDEPIVWERLGDLARGEAPVPGLRGLALELIRTQDGRFTGALTGGQAFRAEFDTAHGRHVALFADGDFDGAVSQGDYWVAGPAAVVDALRFPNPGYEMRTLSEAWCLGGQCLRIAAAEASGRVVIETGAGGVHSALRNAHAARLDRDFFANVWQGSRAEFLREHGDAADRPFVAEPAPWQHVRDLEEAREYAAARGLPLVLEITSMSCPWCRLMSWTHQDEEVDRLLRGFARAKLVIDLDPTGSRTRLGVQGVPCTMLLGADGEEVARLAGCKGPGAYAEWLRPHAGDGVEKGKAR